MSAGEPTASPDPLESQILGELRSAREALLAGELGEAARRMETAGKLCQEGLSNPSRLSTEGLAAIQRLFAECLETGRPLQEALARQMAGSGNVAKAVRAYKPRR